MLRKNVSRMSDDALGNGACGTLTGFRWSQGMARLHTQMVLKSSLTVKMWAGRADHMVMRALSQAPLLFTQ